MKVDEKGQTLFAFLRGQLTPSGKEIKRGLERGGCLLNGVIERFGSTRLSKGDFVLFDLNKTKRPSPFFSPQILFEDPDLVICSKPSGLVSDPLLFRAFLKRTVFLVHRLDKETSGVIIIAKNQKKQKEMEALFRKREVSKTYLALVSGNVQKKGGRIENHLFKKSSYQGQSIWGVGKKGLLSLTEWTCLQKGKGVSFLQCQPKTGRTHQLRVHLSEMGHPILGDLLYGRHRPFPSSVNRLFLHAYQVAFTHPKTGKPLRITAPIPKVFQSFLVDVREHSSPL